jgi:hypothetical protein
MPDSRTRQRRGRKRIAGEEDDDIRRFADEHGLTSEQVRELIDRVGNSREALEAALALMKG